MFDDQSGFSRFGGDGQWAILCRDRFPFRQYADQYDILHLPKKLRPSGNTLSHIHGSAKSGSPLGTKPDHCSHLRGYGGRQPRIGVRGRTRGNVP